MAVTVIQIVICGELLNCVNKIKGCETLPVNFVDTLSFAKARNRLSKLVYLTFGRARPKLG